MRWRLSHRKSYARRSPRLAQKWRRATRVEEDDDGHISGGIKVEAGTHLGRRGGASAPRRALALNQAAVLPAVHRQRGSGDETRGVAGEENNRGRQLIGASVPAERDVTDATRGELGGINAELDRLTSIFFLDSIGFEAAGCGRVDSDFARG